VYPYRNEAQQAARFSYKPHYIHPAWKLGYTSDSSAGTLGGCPTKEPKESLCHLACAAAVRPTWSVGPNHDVGRPSEQFYLLRQSQLPELTLLPNRQTRILAKRKKAHRLERTFFEPATRMVYSCFCHNISRLGFSVDIITRRPVTANLEYIRG
jgi:hypothetical protein